MSDKEQNQAVQVVTEVVKTLRASFASKKTLSLSWRLSQLRALQKLCTEGRDQLCAALKKDLHKSIPEGYFTEVNLVEQEIQHAIDCVSEWMCPEKVSTNILNIPGKSYICQDPLGVVLVIGAWNYPVNLSLLPVVGAIAAGNCVVLKVPSEKYSAASSHAIAVLFAKYMDKSCIQAVEGDRHMTQAVLTQRWDKIFFTGGCYVGKMVAEAAAKHLTPVTLELGGKSPCIVDKTANLKVAAMRFSWGAFMNAGQTCIRPDYLLVHSSVATQFIKEVRGAIEKMYTTQPKKSEWFGRLINARAHQRVVEVLQKDKQYIKYGGEFDESDLYVAPTILDFGKDTNAFLGSAAMQDEIFAPVIPVLYYESIDQIIHLITTNEKPLACYLFSNDSHIQQRVLKETSSGCCVINDTMMQMSNAGLPFGGVGHSGMGSYHGKYSFDCFTHKKSVLQRPFYLDAPIRYPPYSNIQVKILEFLQKPKSKSTIRLIQLFLFCVFLLAFVRHKGLVSQFLSFLANLLEKLAQFLQD